MRVQYGDLQPAKWNKFYINPCISWLLQEIHLVLLTRLTAKLLPSPISSAHVVSLTNGFCISASPEPDLFLSDKPVAAMLDHIAKPIVWSLTQCRTCLLKVPQDTGDAIKYDPQIKKWDIPWQPSDESCLPFVRFHLLRRSLCDPRRRGPCMHISAYLYIPFFRGCGQCVTSI